MRGETFFAREADEAGGGAFQRTARIIVKAFGHGHQKQRLAVRGALALRIERVGDHHVGVAAEIVIAADLAVVHEAPPAMGEGVAVVAAGGGAGRGADVGEEQRRLHLCGQAAQVRVGPRGQHVAVKARFGALAIPRDAKAVGVDCGMALGGTVALVDQRMSGAADDLLKEDRRAGVGRPAAHQAALFW